MVGIPVNEFIVVVSVCGVQGSSSASIISDRTLAAVIVPDFVKVLENEKFRAGRDSQMG